MAKKVTNATYNPVARGEEVAAECNRLGENFKSSIKDQIRALIAEAGKHGSAVASQALEAFLAKVEKTAKQIAGQCKSHARRIVAGLADPKLAPTLLEDMQNNADMQKTAEKCPAVTTAGKKKGTGTKAASLLDKAKAAFNELTEGDRVEFFAFVLSHSAARIKDPKARVNAQSVLEAMRAAA